MGWNNENNIFYFRFAFFFFFFFLFEKIKSNSYNRIDVTIDKITLNKINLFERRKKRLTNLFDNCDFNESLHVYTEHNN